MLSLSDIEKLITVKKREIELEKTNLGLSPPLREHSTSENDKENAHNLAKHRKQVKFTENQVLRESNDSTRNKKENSLEDNHTEFEDFIPAELERYIRRYIGLPGMLKAGEYSPNNPLVRAERAPGDALLGLGEYERRRNTLRKIRQQQYREYLDQQAKKKQEAKDQAERERRERELRDREREDRELELVQERDRYSPSRRRSVQLQSGQQLQTSQSGQQLQSSQSVQNFQYDSNVPSISTASGSYNKVDTGVQVDGFSQPLSVAVQTDDSELFPVSPATEPCPLARLTRAERELSPRNALQYTPETMRRRSYGDFDERSYLLKKCNRDKTSDLRHSYRPSIFDADAIRLRNLQAEKDAAERRQYYQQELRNQIMEQQRIREERKNREKMLEQAEMRRLEEQLRMLRMAQEQERGRQHHITAQMKHSATDYNTKRTQLQREIDLEQEQIIRANSQPNKNIPKNTKNTSKSDTAPSKLPFYYPQIYESNNEKPYSLNIPDNSIFSSNYDVDSYLRKNLNFNKKKKDNYEIVETPTDANIFEIINSPTQNMKDKSKIAVENENKIVKENNILEENALIHDNTIHRPNLNRPYVSNLEDPSKNNFENILERRDSKTETNARSTTIDSLPIPVLRHTPKSQNEIVENMNMSDAMKKVDDKFKVPAVQKNILKALPNEEGRNISILTQLGSIRRQLQLEQLKLDNMISKQD